MTTLRKPSIWTPWGQVLCFECHGVTLRGRTLPPPVYAKLCSLQPAREDEHPGTCDECGCDVWTRHDLWILQSIRDAVGGELQQTGGMCAGLWIEADSHAAAADGDGPGVFVAAMDGPIDASAWPSQRALSESEGMIRCGTFGSLYELADSANLDDAITWCRAALGDSKDGRARAARGKATK